ncbi:hypothetical protein PG999_006062 [Apiospora kogelbergensis]|uniref:SMP-30/Gluconolactonase/LRE-like region domain-containing protein n=1 Tax=Apiospora kogelbergensis TaxID=1337665 RepID=A0AAW0QVT1_9PEZI
MAATIPAIQGDTLSLPLPSREVYQFGNPNTSVENIAVRRNGDLLVTLLAPSAQLHLIRDPYSEKPSVSLVHHFDEVEGLLGIAETKPDTFLVMGSNLEGKANASAVFEVDFSTGHTVPSTRLVARISESRLLNGAAALPGCGRGLVLVAESILGQVFRVDARTGHYDVAIDVTQMKGDPKALVPVGINGIKVHDGYVYFSNSFTVSIYRLKITEDGSPAEGAVVETVATFTGEKFLDDFTFGRDGTIWAASNKGNTLYAISPGGKAILVLGSASSTVLKSDTAGAFGRTEQDRHMLYVTTNMPGRVVAVDTSMYRQ